MKLSLVLVVGVLMVGVLASVGVVPFGFLFAIFRLAQIFTLRLMPLLQRLASSERGLGFHRISLASKISMSTAIS
jgi:hypothetical protein